LFGLKSTPDEDEENPVHVLSEDSGTITAAPKNDVFVVLNPGPDYVIQPVRVIN